MLCLRRYVLRVSGDFYTGVQEAGVEPARVLSPPDFESGASANSATLAIGYQRGPKHDSGPPSTVVGGEGFEPPTLCL